MEESNRIRASANAGHQQIWETTKLLNALPPRLLPDNSLEIPHLQEWKNEAFRNQKRSGQEMQDLEANVTEVNPLKFQKVNP